MSSKKVIIFSAPSGSGKTTLVKYCLEKFEKLRFSISATTRNPRGVEKHGTDYFFFSPDNFRKGIEDQIFIEFEEVYKDKYYGTLKSEIERVWSANNIVIFDVDVKGGVNLKKHFGDKALSLFIAPPSIDILAQRLYERNTDDEKTIKNRLEKAEEEMTYSKYFDEIVVNDDLELAKKEVFKLINDFISSK